MDDLISRQAAIDALWKALYEYEDKTEKQFQESEYLDVGDWIEHRIFVLNMNDIDRLTILNLPSAQRWIPCSERLPETDEDGYSDKLLVCFSNFTGHEICEYRIIDGIGKWYIGDSDECPDDIEVKVIAWMPLPEPYKENTNEQT